MKHLFFSLILACTLSSVGRASTSYFDLSRYYKYKIRWTAEFLPFPPPDSSIIYRTILIGEVYQVTPEVLFTAYPTKSVETFIVTLHDFELKGLKSYRFTMVVEPVFGKSKACNLKFTLRPNPSIVVYHN